MAIKPVRLLSPLSRNILIINLITLMIPVLGFLYLADYRQELIRSELESLSHEARTFADALAEGAVSNLQGGFQFLDMTNGMQILRRVSRDSNTRAILFLSDGTLIADTRFMNNDVTAGRIGDAGLSFRNTVEKLVDGFHFALNYLEDLSIFERYREPTEMHIRALPHAIQALRGKTTVKVWLGNRAGDLVISAASAVRPLHRVFGVLVVSRITDQVEATIRELRHNILSAFVISIVFTITMSLLLARQIARPLSRLARAASRIDAPNIPLHELHIPILNAPNDEIGILSRALSTMTENLRARITTIEGFAADVAHEIRNPISGIASALEAYQVVKSPEKRAELLSMAQAELTRIDMMIDDILESSRLDAAIQEENREMINLVQWLKQFSLTFHDLQQDHELVAELPEQHIWVSFKESRLTQTMQNLLSNAFDFQPQGKAIYLEIQPEGEMVNIIVMDQGPGIPAQALEKIFERFYSDRPNKDKALHTGLGLSIVKQIVEGYNGTIRAENRPSPETGAIFTITLPIAHHPNAAHRKA